MDGVEAAAAEVAMAAIAVVSVTDVIVFGEGDDTIGGDKQSSLAPERGEKAIGDIVMEAEVVGGRGG